MPTGTYASKRAASKPQTRWWGVYYKSSNKPAAIFGSKSNADTWCAEANKISGDYEPAPGWVGYEVRVTRAIGVKPIEE